MAGARSTEDSMEGLGVGSRRYRRGQTVTYNFAAPGSPADVKTKLSASSFRNVCGPDWHLLSQSWPGPLVRNKPRARGPCYVGVATACSLSNLAPRPPPGASLLLRSAAVSLPPFPRRSVDVSPTLWDNVPLTGPRRSVRAKTGPRRRTRRDRKSRTPKVRQSPSVSANLHG